METSMKKSDFENTQLKRILRDYKQAVTFKTEKSSSYALSSYHPISHTVPNGIYREGTTTITSRTGTPCTLFIVTDISKPLTEETRLQIESVLNETAAYFSSNSGDVKGRAYQLSLDDEQISMTHLTDSRGISIEKNFIPEVFSQLNQQFVLQEKEPYSNWTTYSFVFDEQALFEQGILNVNADIHFQKLKTKITSRLVDSPNEAFEENWFDAPLNGGYKCFNQFDVVREYGNRHISNIPFLIIFSDNPEQVKRLGPMYAKSPGNILYILPELELVHSIFPRNFIYWGDESEERELYEIEFEEMKSE